MTFRCCKLEPRTRRGPVLAVTAWLGTLGFVASAGAETLTRGEAVARALAQNPQVAAARAEEFQARARKKQADAARYPELTVTLAVGPSLKAEVAPGTAIGSTENSYGDVGLNDLSAVFGGQVELLQPLYTFGKIDHRRAAAEHEIRARRAQTDMTRADVAVQVAELYETALFARDVERFFDEMRHWLSRSLEDTRAQLGTDPALSEQDVLRLETALGVVEMAINQARAGIRQTRAGLTAYLALPRDGELELAESSLELLSPGPLDEAALVRLALQHRPELTALREGKAAYDELAEAEQADDLPDVFALAFASGAYTPGRDLIDTRYYADPFNHFVPGALLGVRWRYQGAAASGRADVTRAMAAGLARTKDWAELGLPAEVTKAFEDVRRAKLDVQTSEDSVQKAKKWMVRAAADFGVGLGSTRDVTEASSAYAQLRVAYFHAKLRHNVALAQLAKATGTLTSGNGRLYPTRPEAIQAPESGKATAAGAAGEGRLIP